tara:strand:+ start:61869 stop:62384 length:516 start_codon:yes stop_codon:yes gene_type:complete
MHETYTTPGFVLKARPNKEDSVEAIIFTQDLGKIRVIAQAAKRAGATFAACTQPGTHSIYSLIRGRYNWRLKGMDQVQQYSFTLTGERKKVYANILGLLGRLLPEHEVQQKVYERLEALVKGEEDIDFEREEAEIAFEILVALGYADKDAGVSKTEDLILEVNKGILAAGL